MRQASDLRDVLWHRRDKLHLAAEFSNQASRRSTVNALSRHSGRPLDQQEKLLSKLEWAAAPARRRHCLPWHIRPSRRAHRLL